MMFLLLILAVTAAVALVVLLAAPRRITRELRSTVDQLQQLHETLQPATVRIDRAVRSRPPR